MYKYFVSEVSKSGKRNLKNASVLGTDNWNISCQLSKQGYYSHC